MRAGHPKDKIKWRTTTTSYYCWGNKYYHNYLIFPTQHGNQTATNPKTSMQNTYKNQWEN